MRFMGSRLGYWECKVTFTPTATPVEAFVDGLADDEMAVQHTFFRQLTDQWSGIGLAIAEMLLEKLHECQPNTRPKSAWDIFKVSSLSVPRASIEDAKWEISFANLKDPEHLWTVEMAGRHPKQVTIEG